ncbi:MAG TPA: glycosyltransferase [Albibacterium sp.]|nr:glycosyltransferase [Albibacterium sp.]HUH18000.1 glycosyltransferase [Albibacterium sp.]
MDDVLPKISVIMASYNQGAFIKEALDRLLGQNYPNLELIIVDGCSNDNTFNVLDGYKEYIDILIHEPDRGMYHARNKGLVRATGEVICFLNTDDFHQAGTLNFVGSYFRDNLNVDVLYGICLGVDESGNKLNGYCFGDFELNRKTFFRQLPTFPDQATFIRRECLSVVGLYDLRLKYGADANLWRRCVLFNLEIHRVNRHFANWRIYDRTLTYNPKFKWERFFEAVGLYFRYSKDPFSRYLWNLLFNYFVVQNLKFIKSMFSR